ncbi:ankyrin repeat-containing domain protein [Geopyxis carbonaria]|nr:ankyrin repeat-containing domain protein [Geopyxis carbonaria]
MASKSTQTRTTLLSLPNELHLLIADSLSQPDLTALLRTSRHFHTLITPRLHAHLLTSSRAGTLALNAAAKLPSPDALRYLLKLGIRDRSPRPWCPHTPLHVAALYGNLQSIILLISRGACVNAMDYYSYCTPLHSAIGSFCASPEIVKTLLVNGADVEAVNLHGVAPLGMARKYQRGDLFWILREHGAMLIGSNGCWNSAMERTTDMNPSSGMGWHNLWDGLRISRRSKGGGTGFREAVREVMRGLKEKTGGETPCRDGLGAVDEEWVSLMKCRAAAERKRTSRWGRPTSWRNSIFNDGPS